ncbi:hypothetical protein ACFLXV_03470 [Chloroflexota bacterium]
MKGYRTPSWFRMKGFQNGKQEKVKKDKPGPLKDSEKARERK